MSRPPHERLEALLAKYEALVLLRAVREAAERDGRGRFEGLESEQRRAEMRRVATAHPGALRELDALSFLTLCDRRAEVATLLREPQTAAPAWLLAMDALHESWRAALASNGGREEAERLLAEALGGDWQRAVDAALND